MERLRNSEHILRMIEIKRHRINCIPDFMRPPAEDDLLHYVMENQHVLTRKTGENPERLIETLGKVKPKDDAVTEVIKQA